MNFGLVVHPFTDDNLRLASRIGFNGVLRPDHVPQLHTESGVANGYGMPGRLYAIGYMRGIAESLQLL